MIETIRHFFPTFFPQEIDSPRPGSEDKTTKIALAIIVSLGTILLYYSHFVRTTVLLVGVFLGAALLSEPPPTHYPILLEQHLFSPAAPFPLNIVLKRGVVA
jgi:hypothetical protein